MATTKRPGKPATSATQEIPRPSARKRLTAGFDYLTLNPSPQLRASRQRLERYDPMRETGRMIARAMNEAMRSISGRLKTRQ